MAIDRFDSLIARSPCRWGDVTFLGIVDFVDCDNNDIGEIDV